MKTQSRDTRPEIEEIQISLIRNASIARKVSVVRSLSETTMRLSRKAIARANPGLNDRELDLKFVEYHYGKALANNLREYMDRKAL